MKTLKSFVTRSRRSMVIVGSGNGPKSKRILNKIAMEIKNNITVKDRRGLTSRKVYANCCVGKDLVQFRSGSMWRLGLG